MINAASVKPIVSAVIPMLNARTYVADTLDGVFGQTVPPHEVIVVDNGSTDGSPAFARERYPRARVISEPVPGAIVSCLETAGCSPLRTKAPVPGMIEPSPSRAGV